MIDNFDQILDLLEFNSPDEFYFVQIIQRKKDNKGVRGCNNNNRAIKSYYIKSKEHLLDLKEEMIILANHFNARVGINLNKRSFERTAFHTLKTISDQIMNREYSKTHRAYNTACGRYSNGDKRWIIDIDDVEEVSPVMMSFINYRCEPISQSLEDSKIIATIKTKSGYHIISKPFNLAKFREEYPELDIHKNNPTILYIP